MDTRHRSPARDISAYTLTELMIGLALVGILLSWGVPNFVGVFQRNLLSTQTDLLVHHLFYARTEAITRNLPVVVCRSENARNCTPSSSSKADWSMGWLVFVNTDNDKTRDPDEPILRVGNAVPAPISVHFNQWWRIKFRPNGGAGNGSFTLCDGLGNNRRITVYRSGRTRVTKINTDEEFCPAS